ncbi:MAG: SMC family ATPase, partial [Oscillospiraceae bacterium]|nr:SMC family ATPase [Oscillospiraceae bacterium]
LERIQQQIAGYTGKLEFPSKNEAERHQNSLRQEYQTIQRQMENAEKAYQAGQNLLTNLNGQVEQLKRQLAEAGETDCEQQLARQKVLSAEQTETLEKQKTLHARITSNQTALHNIRAKAEECDTRRQKLAWMEAVDKTARGQLTGKEKINLETYVQTAFFDRIIARANLRLMIMSGGQYELQRRRREELQGRSGLDLDVIDHYDGSSRPRSVKTLSGGESFLASLSLALGLSDEIQSSAGGIRLDTMFVDEGFGSLDEETLRQALKALASLTEGDRLVGVISHVSELKDRIDKQIVVRRERGGERKVHIQA